jgi:hypothetical protein
VASLTSGFLPCRLAPAPQFERKLEEMWVLYVASYRRSQWAGDGMVPMRSSPARSPC